MRKTSKVLAVAAVAIAAGFAFVPKASACGSCLSQPAVIDSSVISQPVVLDRSVTTAPMILNEPAVIDTSVVSPMYRTFDVAPVRRSLLNLDTPFFGIHLF